MGLDVSHDAWSGGYVSFNRLRHAVAHAAGWSWPPHYELTADGEMIPDGNGGYRRKPDLDHNMIYFPDGTDQTGGLWEFLTHSDCDGHITPAMCRKVADDLEALIPKLPAWKTGGHLARAGGLEAAVRQFVKGCRAAAKARQRLVFR